LSCGVRFTTYERIQQSNLFVIKKDQRREPFRKEKLLNGMRRACEKRPIAGHAIERLADEIETDLYAQGKTEVPATLIGDMVMERLKKLDHIAYIRFASVYRDFTDITRLKQEVDSLAGVGVNAPVELSPSAQLPLLPDTETSRIMVKKQNKNRN
jgi:transcriptional repressor NrdR